MMAGMADSRKRWDTDTRCAGPPPRLGRRRARSPPGTASGGRRRFRAAGASLRHRDDGALEVAAEHSPGDSRRDIRRRAWTLTGTIAEPAASVRERRDGETVVFEVVTGIPDGSGPFASHGHALRIRVRPPTVPSPAHPRSAR